MTFARPPYTHAHTHTFTYTDEAPEHAERKITDELEHIHNVRLSAKACSFDFGKISVPSHGTSASQGENPTLLEVQVLIALNNNAIESHMLKVGLLALGLVPFSSLLCLSLSPRVYGDYL